jgi:hypothetical protein
LNEQIDSLAGGVGGLAKSHGHRWRIGLGMAAGVGVMGGVAILDGVRDNPGTAKRIADNGQEVVVGEPDHAAHAEDERGVFPVKFERKVGDGEYEGILLDGRDMPKQTWGFNVSETEVVHDEESGWEVQIVQERREEVWIPVNSL